MWLLFFGGLNITVLKPVSSTSNSIGYLISAVNMGSLGFTDDAGLSLLAFTRVR